VPEGKHYVGLVSIEGCSTLKIKRALAWIAQSTASRPDSLRCESQWPKRNWNGG
jgi:hypothetical protein